MLSRICVNTNTQIDVLLGYNSIILSHKEFAALEPFDVTGFDLYEVDLI